MSDSLDLALELVGEGTMVMSPFSQLFAVSSEDLK
jgi:hypothetical protein